MLCYQRLPGLIRLIVVTGLFAATATAETSKAVVDVTTAQKLGPYLQTICDRIMKLDVGSGSLKGTTDTQWSIFINGNLARVLVASYRLTGNREHLAEALRWCDTLHSQQQLVTDSQGEEAGYWGDKGATGNIWFGDGGTAAAAMAVGSRHADAKRQRIYRNTLDRYVRFMRYGAKFDPQQQDRGGSPGWIITEGPDAGALGCGYYKGKLSREPYTIATANTGAAFLSEYYSLTSSAEAKETAANAVRWLVRVRKPDGLFPNILAGQNPHPLYWPLAYMTYCGEAMIAVHRFVDDPQVRTLIERESRASVDWVLRTQNPDGTFGANRSDDQQRSAGVITLLSWYYSTVKPDPAVKIAIEKYFAYMLDPAHSKEQGVYDMVRTTGFVGLTVAEALRPGVTF